MMTHAVENGTGRAARVAGVTVGGKTGTAELTAGTSHAWFVGFAPWPEPRIAFAIVIEHGGYGGVAAAPVAARLIEKASELGILNEPVRVSGEDPS